METGMRIPPEVGGTEGGVGGGGDGGKLPSVGSMRWARNYQGARFKSRGARRESRFRRESRLFYARYSRTSDDRAKNGKVSQLLIVLLATLATLVSGISDTTVRAVILGLLPAPTFTSKIEGTWPKKAHLNIFFLASFGTGPKMFRLLQCARIAEQHWVSTEAIT